MAQFRYVLEIAYIGKALLANLTLISITAPSFDFFLKGCSDGQSFTSDGSVCHSWFAQETVGFNKILVRGLFLEKTFKLRKL